MVKSENLLGICLAAGATKNVSVPAAKKYIRLNLFYLEGIEVQWMDNSNCKPYHQLYLPFKHEVTGLDLIFNEGRRSP